MIPFAPAQVFLAIEPVDMRKSFRGLSNLTRNILTKNPKSGCYFVFANRLQTLLKILYWDGTGYCLFCKKLKRSRIQWPKINAEEASVSLTG